MSAKCLVKSPPAGSSDPVGTGRVSPDTLQFTVNNSDCSVMEAELRDQCNELLKRIVHLRDCL